MYQLESLLSSYSVWGNTLWEYGVATVIFFVSVLVLKAFQSIILARLRKLAKKTATDIDDAFIETISKISSWFYIIIPAYVASRYIWLSGAIDKWMRVLFMIALVYEVIRALEHLIGFGLKKYISTSKKKKDFDPHSESMVRIAGMMVRGLLWLVALLLILSNLGFNISSLVASLGIGGIAIALAVQNILSDIFSSFSLFIDKPFQVGDYIIVGEHSGTVSKIGLKTTRLKAPRGEEIVISNKELTSARVQNLKHLKKRREVLSFSVTYQTTEAQLKKIPSLVQALVEPIELCEFDRCHFANYASSGLDFELVYYIDTSEYQTYMDVKQEVNLALFVAFRKENIDMAYPTQTLYVHKEK